MGKRWKAGFLRAVLALLLLLLLPGFCAAPEACAESVIRLPVELPEEAVYTQSLIWEGKLLTVSWFEEGEARASLWDCQSGELLEESSLPEVSMGTVRAAKDGLLEAYNANRGEFLVIGAHFRTERQICLPESPGIYPVITPDRSTVYYVSSDGNLKRYETETQTAETIPMERKPDYGLSPEAVMADGKVLLVSGWEENQYQLTFLDTETWEELERTDRGMQITASGEAYTAFLYDSIYQLIYGNLCGTEETKELLLAAEEEYSGLKTFPGEGLVLTHYEIPGGAMVLSLYNLETGLREAVAKVSPGNQDGFFGDAELLYLPETEQVAVVSSDGVLVWTPALDQTGETLSRSVDYYRDEAALLQELAPRKKEAELLSDTYGIEIYVGEQCERDFFDYTAEIVREARLVEKGLEELRKALADYPEDFFRQLGEGEYGVLKIYLTGALTPVGTGGISDASGLYYCSGSEQYLALNLEEWAILRETFYHETAHAVDCRMHGTLYQSYSDAEWDSLNPEGFSYAYSYEEGQLDGAWVVGLSDTAYFIDDYSKTFPAEDRARILEYAMAYGDLSVYFQDEPILEKLRYLSERIREAFDTRGWPNTVLWEKPLKENLKVFEKLN